MREEWRPVVGYEGIYDVSDKGKIRSFKWGKWKERKLTKTNMGYVRTCLMKNNMRSDCFNHRLVAEAFLNGGKPLEKWQVVHHIDHKKDNNCPSNLNITDHAHNVMESHYIRSLKKEIEELKNGRK